MEKVTPDVGYQVTCSCGQVLSGSRQDRFQVVRCPTCNSDRFILPRSPFLDAVGKSAPVQEPSSRVRLSLKVWLVPVLATVFTAGGLLLVYLIFFRSNNPSHNGSEKKEPKSAQERLVQAEKYLGEGSFRLAANELEAAPAEALTASQSKRWRQLHTEAALLADVSDVSLEKILSHAAGLSQREWQAEFPVRYKNKAFLFDDHFQRLASGRVQAIYTFPKGDPVRLEWRELDLLRDMDLDQPRRVILGVRLAAVTLEPPGPTWVVHFQPKSGVLLTDPTAAALCCPPLGEADAPAILKKQAQLVEQMK
jgi:hypothetical protein